MKPITSRDASARVALSIYNGTIISAICLLLSACLPRYTVPSDIYVITKDKHEQKLLSDVHVAIEDSLGNVIFEDESNQLGLTKFNLKNKGSLSQYRLKVWSDSVHFNKSDLVSIQLNDFLDYYDVGLDIGTGDHGTQARTADMHYHLTMKSYNSFGPEITAENPGFVGTAMNFKNNNKLKVLHKGKWKNAPAKRLLKDYESGKGDTDMLARLLEGKYVRPRKKNNGIDEFTQATNPHLRDGNVALAYNSISPLEYNLVRSGFNRLLGSFLKTRARLEWLEQMGKDERTFTHWENFLSEYNYFKTSWEDESDKPWELYEHDLNGTSEARKAVLVVEGGHIFQDEIFPHDIRYWIPGTGYHRREKARLMQLLAERQGKSINITNKDVRQMEQYQKGDRNMKMEKIGRLLEQDDLLEQEFTRELIKNVDYLKGLKSPEVSMVTISHLSYNGMVGHAPAFDDATTLGRILAQRVFRLRVGNDRRYKKQWNGYFFSGLGPKEYGKKVIDRLVNPAYGGRTIQVDLKHCDYLTRKYFLDSVANKETIPPICSHCAVTGLSEIYYSPASDEYALRDSRLVKNFYPFSLNLFDEEVLRIYQLEGIIGIPLEQRVLGGYLDSRQNLINYKYFECRQGKKTKRTKFKRSKIIEKSILELKETADSDYLLAVDYTKRQMLDKTFAGFSNKEKDRRITQIIIDDYWSAEPFIQNIFYMVDLVMEKSGVSAEEAFSLICIGSDLDGIMDPLDICPVASMYPHFRNRLEHFIPMFLKLRVFREEPFDLAASLNSRRDNRRELFNKVDKKYFSDEFSLADALDDVFYENLAEFTKNKMFN